MRSAIEFIVRTLLSHHYRPGAPAHVYHELCLRVPYLHTTYPTVAPGFHHVAGALRRTPVLCRERCRSAVRARRLALRRCRGRETRARLPIALRRGLLLRTDRIADCLLFLELFASALASGVGCVGVDDRKLVVCLNLTGFVLKITLSHIHIFRRACRCSATHRCTPIAQHATSANSDNTNAVVAAALCS